MYNGLLKSSHHRQYAILSAFDAKYNIHTAPGKISKCFDNPVSGYSIEGPGCIFFLNINCFKANHVLKPDKCIGGANFYLKYIYFRIVTLR